jgi:hypothetical protein
MPKQKSFLQTINDWIRDSEHLFLNVITAISPWLAPIAPAFGTYSHASTVLEFPIWIALIIALVVEFLGLTTISTAITFWRHNKRYKAARSQAPTYVPILAFLFYLFVIISVNVLLDFIPQIAAEWEWTVILTAKSLLYLLTIPAASILAVRADQAAVIESYRRPAKPAVQPAFIDSQTEGSAPQKLYECPACDVAYEKVQSLSAHYRHNPGHNPHKKKKILEVEKDDIQIMPIMR